MTAPSAVPGAPGGVRRWYTRPGTILPVVVGLIVLAALLAPDREFGRTGDSRLSTYSTEPQGARLFYELAGRLGWHTEQRRTEDFPAGSDVVIAELDPAEPLRTTEVHALLERVRAGAALLAVVSSGEALADSLRIVISDRGGQPERGRDTLTCAPVPHSLAMFTTIWPADVAALFTLRVRPPHPDSIVHFVVTEGAGSVHDAAIGFSYGRGRVVVGGDPDLLRNDAIRVCKYDLDVPAVRMLEYLRAGSAVARSRVSFDEFRQGYGEHPGTLGAIAHYLTTVSSGRLFLQLLAAGLVVLLAAAPRALPAHDPAHIERRSPLEHVDALGRAYAQVGATRSATARLVRGVRRRLAGGGAGTVAGGSRSDDEFLARAERDVPALAPDVAAIRRALSAGISRHEFAHVGAALERLELSLTRA